jgi:hypothetical protein
VLQEVGIFKLAEPDSHVRFVRQEVKTSVTRTLILNVRFVRQEVKTSVTRTLILNLQACAPRVGMFDCFDLFA